MHVGSLVANKGVYYEASFSLSAMRIFSYNDVLKCYFIKSMQSTRIKVGKLASKISVAVVHWFPLSFLLAETTIFRNSNVLKCFYFKMYVNYKKKRLLRQSALYLLSFCSSRVSAAPPLSPSLCHLAMQRVSV